MIERKNIRELRAEQGLDQSVAAERLGLTQSGLSKLERDPNPQVQTLRDYVRRILPEGELRFVVDVLDLQTGDLVTYELEPGVSEAGWSGPVETYTDRDAFYASRPHLAEGYGWRPGDPTRGSAPFGSDEIFRVPSSDPTSGDRDQLWTITICAPARALGLAWPKREDPVLGTVVATGETGEIWVLAADADVRPVARALRRLHTPNLEQVGAAVEKAVR